MTASNDNESGRSARTDPSKRLRRLRGLLVLLAVVLGVAAAELPYFHREMYFFENPGGRPNGIAGGKIHQWRIVWDTVYLEWIVIGVAAAVAIAFVGRKTPSRRNRPRRIVVALAVV